MNRRIFSNNLFYNEKFVITFSILLAFVIWVILSMGDDKSKEHRTITDIPISVELSQNARKAGLIVDESDTKLVASVQVEGNILAIGRLTKDSISISAKDADKILEPGEYPLKLVAKASDASYTIDSNSIKPQEITVRVDKHMDSTFEVKNAVKYNVADGYYDNGIVFDPKEIIISGSEGLVSKIQEIKVEQKLSDISQDMSVEIPLTVLDKAGNRLSEDEISKLKFNHSKVKADISVWKKVKLPIKVNIENMEASKFNYSVDPESVEVAMPEKLLQEIKEISLKPINPSQITSKNKNFELDIDFPKKCKNLSHKTKASVTISLKN